MPQDVVFHSAETREFKDFGFMQAYLAFKPHLGEDRRRFGSLITIDDGTLVPGAQGFGLHPHKDVEVVTFLVDGEVSHIDPNVHEHNGNLSAKGIQVITAGTGIIHNEVNKSDVHPMRALQIWFEPRSKNLPPNYSKKELETSDHTNKLQLILAPDGAEGALVAQQDAHLSYGLFTSNQLISYEAFDDESDIYVFMIGGTAATLGYKLKKGDGLGLRHADKLEIRADAGAEFLVFDLAGGALH